MSLVVDPRRTVVAVSLLREPPASTMGSSALSEVGAMLCRGVEDYFSTGTGVPATAEVSEPGINCEPGQEVARALGWDNALEPIELRLERAALAQLVDRFYGGDGDVGELAKALSASEERFLDRLASSLAPLLGAAWRRFRSIEPKVLSSRAAASAATVQTLVVACGDWTPVQLRFRYPLSTLEWLTIATDAKQADEDAAAENWSQDLTALVLSVPFPVRTILAEPEVPISKLRRLAEGDVLPIRVPPQMDLCVAGIRIAKGTVGDHEGRAAFRLD